MNHAATFISMHHLLVAAAAVLLIAPAITFAFIKLRNSQRNLVTGTLLALVSTSIYPIVFQKYSASPNSDVDEIEQTTELILVSKVKPMRNENLEFASILPSQRNLSILVNLNHGAPALSCSPSPNSTDDSGPLQACTELPDPQIFHPKASQSLLPQPVAHAEHTLSAKLALMSAEHI